MTTRQIQRGTTLSKMVAAYNREFKAKLTVADVAKANGLKDPNKIQAGGTLIFPDAFETTAPTQVIKNAEGGKTVRNGIKAQVEVRSEPELVTTEPGKISTTVQNRPLEKLPEAPKPTLKQPELISTEPGKISTTVQPRPLEKLPEAPKPTFTQPELIKTEPGKISTTVQPRPLEKLPEAPKPEEKTTLSLSEFLAANKDQKLSVDSLRRNGVRAASSDLNGDGVIAGKDELSALFATAERPDKNKDKTVADLSNAAVGKSFAGIDAASRLETAPYSTVDLTRVETTLRNGSLDSLTVMSPADAKARGLSPGSTELRVSSPVDESKGMGNRSNSVSIYRDAKTGEYFKEYNNDADGKNTPTVPLTEKEKELVRNLDPATLPSSAQSTPALEAMRTELFSFDGDM